MSAACATEWRCSATPASPTGALVAGKTVTGFANIEEDFADLIIEALGR